MERRRDVVREMLEQMWGEVNNERAKLRQAPAIEVFDAALVEKLRYDFAAAVRFAAEEAVRGGGTLPSVGSERKGVGIRVPDPKSNGLGAEQGSRMRERPVSSGRKTMVGLQPGGSAPPSSGSGVQVATRPRGNFEEGAPVSGRTMQGLARPRMEFGQIFDAGEREYLSKLGIGQMADIFYLKGLFDLNSRAFRKKLKEPSRRLTDKIRMILKQHGKDCDNWEGL